MMDETTGARRSIWLDTAEVTPRVPLQVDTDVDVCVIGAGIAGLTTAYRLARDGRTVIVLDDGEIGSGETGRTTAHLVNALDDFYKEIRRYHGEDGARLAADSHTAAIDFVEHLIQEEDIACDFERVDGYLFLGPHDPVSVLDEELEATHAAGLTAITKLPRAPLEAFDTGPCLHFPRQAQFNPLQYLMGLARAFESRGGRICTNSHAERIRGGDSASVRTRDGHTVTARHIVVATNTPINDLVTMHTKQAAYRTYVIGIPLEAGVMPHVLLWDTPDPYHYVRVATGPDGEEVLIVGGEDHKTGQPEDEDAEDRFDRLLGWTRKRFPVTGEPRYQWSGQIMEPVDLMAFIGRNPGDDNVYIATGDSGNGMTHGTIAGLLISDLIAGHDNPWATLYDPSRKTLRAAKEFARETANMAAQYADLVTGGDVDTVDEIAPGTGAVIRRGLSKVAVYRADDGTLTERSAICTHLGCVVQWNDGEKTWDCPCHGSRFAPEGRVLNGPAVKDLKLVDPVAPAEAGKPRRRRRSTAKSTAR
ncbi:MAG TPA: FAD-dependent oxidoreductase [Vicinamibacterales bacterium]|nr:FAD-dependent oxidoreductase [Vicinamibacterales bacterium]